jgi:coenzyme F420-reducing hydrogenase gamma subunit
MVVENDTELLRELRRDLIDMLFVEGNHFCMFCEKSGACELQALAYRFGITAPRYPFLAPRRGVDATHPDVLIDHNRCVLCARCIRASREVDGKNVFQFVLSTGSRSAPRSSGPPPAPMALRRKLEGDMAKPRVATTSLAGCFGCHMSLLDIDERLLELVDLVEFDRSPINDRKRFGGRCRIGLVEGGCANEENVRVLQGFREHCDILVSVGDCAITGGLPALRNGVPLAECLREAYLTGVSVHNPDGHLPGDDELPRLLDRVYPCHEVVKIDYHLPGCPPPADALWEALCALVHGRSPQLPYALIKYD